MSLDISSVGNDIGLVDTQTMKAANILSIQVGSLEYAPDLGIDLKYFLSEQFSFQNESFKSYLIQALANRSINIASLDESVETLFTKYVVNVSPSADDKSMVAR